MPDPKRNIERKPIHEFKVHLSEDKRFWVFKEVTTWIIPVQYLDAISKKKASSNPQLSFSEIEAKVTGVEKSDDRTS